MKLANLDDRALLRLEKQWKDPEVKIGDIRKLFTFSVQEIRRCEERFGLKPRFGPMPQFGRMERK